MGTRGAATVLVVDDDYELRELMVDILRDDGFNVLSARNGREGLVELRGRSVDLVLLDLNMPVMDGPAFRQAQLADPALASIPVMVLSANSDYASTAASLGVSAWLQKPFSHSALLERCLELLASTHAS